MEKQNPPPYSPPEPGFQMPAPQPGYQPPPNQGYQPPPATNTEHHTVIVTHVTPMALGPQPTSVTCPSCHARIVTTVETEATTKTHLFALLLCLFGCFPCCFLPYCINACQSSNHYCPSCRAYLGSYEIACYPCCCIPYCVDSCQSQNHYCPNCRAYLGKYDN